ncbi:hypothetical protein FISHEDRAFT_48774 [Fistulina hepatica ATCC 64428]|uniref:DUF7704 domain-containing protein n=1 Tax=Fistulina hepatica ATCC 64428 TaxID=1128425 RepID=A0A0D7A4G8_9AGAR|nr:hypothetical protein FISHEDRAFT_48774 [Fistulina hepatica ATCC 64428]
MAFAALPGFYQILFLYVEPSERSFPLIALLSPGGTEWMFYQFVPSADPVPPPGMLNANSVMVVWQLVNCYVLLCCISSIVFRAVRDSLSHDPVAQEQIVGASLLALAIGDVGIRMLIIVTMAALPEPLRYSPLTWNSMTHGNISSVVFLLSARIAWFAGVGRTRYYFGQPKMKLN